MAIPEKNQGVKYTYKDYLNWPGEERWELIDGIPYNMSPEPARKHQKILGELFTSIHNYLKNKECEVYSAPFDVRLLTDNIGDEETTNVVQPDISVICDSSKLDNRGCKGSPDLIMEIVAPSTLKKDLKEKFYLYERAGVKEYWIVYPDKKTMVSYILNEDGKCGRPEVYSEEDSLKVNVLESLEINLTDIFKD